MTGFAFDERHIGADKFAQAVMLRELGYQTLGDFARAAVPDSIRRRPMQLPEAVGEEEALAHLRAHAQKNQPLRSMIGQGYYGTFTPAVIQRNVLENPAWYTSYTPYQPEISQGRLEALLNFQTMVSDLTGMEVANASLLDEATAAAEAMMLARRQSKSPSNRFIVAVGVHPQTIDVLLTRASFNDIEVIVQPIEDLAAIADCFGLLIQYPNTYGFCADNIDAIAEVLHAHDAVLCAASDLLALTLLKPPGEMGADIVIGSAQRFGVPLGFGGPHAAFMATHDRFKRQMPGRLVGVSKDARGRPAYRLALQTREQHIRREKATSNICTAQALLAIMAGCYAVYHGAEGLTAIAKRVHNLAQRTAAGLANLGIAPGIENANIFFDTLFYRFSSRAEADAVIQRGLEAGINFRRHGVYSVSCAFDECSTEAEALTVLRAFSGQADAELPADAPENIPPALRRRTAILCHPVFSQYRSETEMMRYLRRLSDYDLALDRTMIPLGSCTMKLNAAAEMQPVSWPEFANIHPFAPKEQTQGYLDMLAELEAWLCEITGYDAVSLQPNSGAQGEYAGLLAIRAYHDSRRDFARNLCLIPTSAHGTNPASAQMAGLQTMTVKCDADGNVDIADLQEKCAQHSERIACIMITYPSTHGVFEQGVRDICRIVHEAGGQVYLDGANFNAQVGLAAPGLYGSDVSHLNMHKTFAIPHGGGGPGVGPIGVKAHLAEFLPGHSVVANGRGGLAVSAAPWGSALVNVISWMYIRMMGAKGLTKASAAAILNANYIAKRLSSAYSILYTAENGLVAHECIVDVRPLKDSAGISVDDIAKRLIDYGFHAPTMSFPVVGTLMVEPTESESLAELDRFCDAMLAIRQEIARVESGEWPQDDNPLVNAPHTLTDISCEWQRAYSRETAIFPLKGMNPAKYLSPVNRIDNAYGDRNVICSCPPIENYEPEA